MSRMRQRKPTAYTRRQFIRTGMIFVPTWFVCRGGSVPLSHLHPKTYDWMSRAVANGGGYNGTSVVAVDKGAKLIVSSNLRSKILRLNFCCGNGYKAGLTPFINDKGSAYDTKTGSTDATGVAYQEFSTTPGAHGGFLAQTAAVDFIDTGLVPSTDMSGLTNDAHLAIYSNGTAGAQASIPIGVALTDSFFLTMSYTALGQVADIWTGTGRPVNADSNGNGCYIGSRTSSSSNGVTQYKNGASTGSSSSVGGSPSNCNVSVYVTAVNSGGGGPISQSTAHWISGYSIGTGLTAAEAFALTNVFETVQRVFGRQGV